MTECTNINAMKNELTMLTKTKPFNDEKFKEFLNKYNIKYDTNQINVIKNECDNISGNLGVNYVGNSPECSKAINDACRILYKDNDAIKQCKKNLSSSFTDIKQTNVSDTTSSCYLSHIDKIASNNNNDKFIIALKSAMGNLPDIECTKLNIKGSVTDHYQNIKRCLNSSLTNQQNIIDTCGKASNVVQTNYSKTIQQCIMGGNAESPTYIESSGTASKTKNLFIIILILICSISFLLLLIIIIIKRKNK